MKVSRVRGSTMSHCGAAYLSQTASSRGASWRPPSSSAPYSVRQKRTCRRHLHPFPNGRQPIQPLASPHTHENNRGTHHWAAVCLRLRPSQKSSSARNQPSSSLLWAAQLLASTVAIFVASSMRITVVSKYDSRFSRQFWGHSCFSTIVKILDCAKCHPSCFAGKRVIISVLATFSTFPSSFPGTARAMGREATTNRTKAQVKKKYTQSYIHTCMCSYQWCIHASTPKDTLRRCTSGSLLTMKWCTQ